MNSKKQNGEGKAMTLTNSGHKPKISAKYFFIQLIAPLCILIATSFQTAHAAPPTLQQCYDAWNSSSAPSSCGFSSIAVCSLPKVKEQDQGITLKPSFGDNLCEIVSVSCAQLPFDKIKPCVINKNLIWNIKQPLSNCNGTLKPVSSCK